MSATNGVFPLGVSLFRRNCYCFWTGSRELVLRRPGTKWEQRAQPNDTRRGVFLVFVSVISVISVIPPSLPPLSGDRNVWRFAKQKGPPHFAKALYYSVVPLSYVPVTSWISIFFLFDHGWLGLNGLSFYIDDNLRLLCRKQRLRLIGSILKASFQSASIQYQLLINI